MNTEPLYVLHPALARDLAVGDRAYVDDPSSDDRYVPFMPAELFSVVTAVEVIGRMVYVRLSDRHAEATDLAGIPVIGTRMIVWTATTVDEDDVMAEAELYAGMFRPNLVSVDDYVEGASENFADIGFSIENGPSGMPSTETIDRFSDLLRSLL